MKLNQDQDIQLKKKYNFLNFTFIKFIFFGTLNTLFAYLILVIFLYFGFHYSIATLISAIASIASGYYLNKNLVFEVKESKNIYLYYLYWFIMYILSVFIQYILLEFINSINLYLNSLIATFIIVIISYYANKFYFFKKNFK